MIVNTFSNWLKLISCGTRPMQDLARSSSRSMSWPNTETVPADFSTSDTTMPIVVVLPAPFGPSSAKKSPGATSRSMPRSAVTPFEYVLVSPRIESACIRRGIISRDVPPVPPLQGLAASALGALDLQAELAQQAHGAVVRPRGAALELEPE